MSDTFKYLMENSESFRATLKRLNNKHAKAYKDIDSSDNYKIPHPSRREKRAYRSQDEGYLVERMIDQKTLFPEDVF